MNTPAGGQTYIELPVKEGYRVAYVRFDGKNTTGSYMHTVSSPMRNIDTGKEYTRIISHTTVASRIVGTMYAYYRKL